MRPFTQSEGTDRDALEGGLLSRNLDLFASFVRWRTVQRLRGLPVSDPVYLATLEM